MIFIALFCFALGMFSLGFFLKLRVSTGGVPAIIAKTCTSVLFMCTGLTALLTANAALSWGVPILIGMLLGLVGDVFLDARVVYPKDEAAWQWAGMSSFTIGHLFFLLAIFRNMPETGSNPALTVLVPLAAGIILACIITFAGPKAGLNFGSFKWLTFTYSAVGLFMTSLSVTIAIGAGGSLRFIIMGTGSVLFLASDFILSKQYFGSGDFIRSKTLIIINHFLYYLGQFLIAATILF